MLQFIDIKASDLDKINAIRSQSEKETRKMVNLAGGGSKSLTFPHETYTLGLSSLKDTGDPTPTPTGIRVIEAGQDNFNFIYDVNKTEEGSEPQMFKDKNFIEGYEKAFSELLENEQEGDNYVVRTLRVPALHIDALWLHDPANTAADKYLPVRSMGLFAASRFYTRQEFYDILKSAADKYSTGDDLLGG